MAGISSQSAGKLENRAKYNGNELQHKEFADCSGLETFDFNTRMYDAQIGRFWQIDRLAQSKRRWSLYEFGLDNPVNFSDPSGLSEKDSAVKINPPKLNPSPKTKPAPSVAPAPASAPAPNPVPPPPA